MTVPGAPEPGGARADHPSEPSPGLSASEVVAAQLDGMRREPRTADGAGPGMQVVWAFASPGNRAATGPLDSFAAMLRSPLYGGLLEHRAAQPGPLMESGEDAQQEVLVLTADDRTLGFTWLLSRQAGAEHKGCWMTEGVLRHPDQVGPDAGPGDPAPGDPAPGGTVR